MAVERMTVSLDAELAAAVREAAEGDGHEASARRRLAARGLSDVVAAWEAEHGAFTKAELEAAANRLAGRVSSCPVPAR